MRDGDGHLKRVSINTRRLTTVRTVDGSDWPDVADHIVRIEPPEGTTPTEIHAATLQMRSRGAVAVKAGAPPMSRKIEAVPIGTTPDDRQSPRDVVLALVEGVADARKADVRKLLLNLMDSEGVR